MQKKKIVVINSVPVNGGDEALLYATLQGLNAVFDTPQVKVLSDNPELARHYIGYTKFDYDWEYALLKADADENQFFHKVKKKVRQFFNTTFAVPYTSFWSRLLASKREKRVYAILKESDAVILSAGGYIHDHYGFDKRLETVKLINEKLNKPYAVFFQSVGPFWNTQNYPKLIHFFKNAHKVILREQYSLSHLKSIGYDGDNVVVSTDLAFYLNSEFSETMKVGSGIHKIALNFREWPYEEEGEHIKDKALLLCKYLIKEGYDLHFISTCQGVKDYKDDSIFAKQIIALLDTEEQKKCVLNDQKFELNELVHQFGSYDAYIGMRLHGAILSLLSNTPALNIAYEDKTLGIYDTMNLADFCFSFKEEFPVWTEKVDNFFLNHASYLNNISDIKKAQEQIVNQHLLELKTIV
ncbi:polysaccharide pyruvyl transferase family protein [uncultured Psychroserpens sp.]|uniref:polysaccharide pyruvyl transferase family protein n=1 Tax=uncultured Psychroserpens sp. TaxID=255436 RepID=UPI00262C506D|nr:polysaccharide pyruvyl transferase family protein [uncultured Psychroserpens sp.]